MKKIFSLLCICFVYSVLFAQQDIIAPGAQIQEGANGVNYIVSFDDIASSGATVSYRINGNSYTWYKYQNGTTSHWHSDNNTGNNLAVMTPDLDAAIGYLLTVDGNNAASIWVVDKKQQADVHPDMISWEADYENQCEEIKLVFEYSNSPNYYENTSGSKFLLTNSYELSYQSLAWNDAEKRWDREQKTENLYLPTTLPSSFATVDSPLTNTRFSLTSNQPNSTFDIESDEYSTVAVSANPDTEVLSIREGLHEADRPSDISKRSGSAPLDIKFKGYPTPAATHSRWDIYKDGTHLITRNEEEHQYSFKEKGKYTVKYTARNEYCSYSDSTIVIEVSESEIQVPNVFTPNNDGWNDEFRVAYKSIIEFEGWIYNRWGRQVYHWTDINIGWNGKIGGKDASPGAYYYIIKAKGSDGIVYNLKGDINLLR